MSENNTILLVEDDQMIALALRIRLVAQGYSVVLADSVARALEALDNMIPRAAVLDINLPDGNGIELMVQIHKTRPDVPLPTIIMTASTSPGLRDTAMQSGAFGFFEKPFPSNLLITKIESLQH